MCPPQGSFARTRPRNFNDLRWSLVCLISRQVQGRSSMSGKRRILVVDDENAIRTLAKTVLERAGYEVTTARDGREAIALLAKSDYDVVLLDVTMPNLNGLGV